MPCPNHRDSIDNKNLILCPKAYPWSVIELKISIHRLESDYFLSSS